MILDIASIPYDIGDGSLGDQIRYLQWFDILFDLPVYFVEQLLLRREGGFVSIDFLEHGRDIEQIELALIFLQYFYKVLVWFRCCYRTGQSASMCIV